MNARVTQRPLSAARSPYHLERSRLFVALAVSPPAAAGTPGRVEFRGFFFSHWWRRVLPVIFLLTAHFVSAQPSIAPEYNVKAGFLTRFVQYTRWPESVFPSTNSPIIIGVLGADPFGEVLEKTAQDETGGRPLRVRHLDNLKQAAECQLVFISKAEGAHEAEWLAALRRLPILTVGESGHTIERGGILQFDIVDDRVRFDANWAAMKAAGLKISSPMLVSARKVFNAPDGVP